MDFISVFRAAAKCFLMGLVGLSLLASPAFPVEYQDSQMFITGFNAYQGKNYQGAIDNMSKILEKYPDSPLRDMAIFWLARANYKAGYRKDAAKYMAQFYKEYPNSPLKSTVEPELAKLAASYAKGEPITDEAPPVSTEKVVTASAAEDRQAAEKADAERAAAEKAFSEKVEAEKQAAQKAARERAAAETAAKAAKAKPAVEREAISRPVAEKPATTKAAKAKTREATPKVRVSRNDAMRAKAIAGYKEVIAKYPGSRAALVATNKLREMGIKEPSRSVSKAAPSGTNAQIMTLEIEQFADCAVTAQPTETAYPVGKPFSIPFEVTNQGNGQDSFSLETLFPEEYDSKFTSMTTPGTPMTVTPPLVAGETFRGSLSGIIPRNSIDGEQVAYPIKAISKFSSDVSQSKQVSFVVSAPLLRAVINPDKSRVYPEESVIYHIALLNAGSADAGKVNLSVDYSHHYDTVDLASSGFREDAKGGLSVQGLSIRSGESKDFTLVFRVKGGVPAQTPLSIRATVTNGELENRESFISASTVVQEISGVAARSNTERVVAIPGQTISVPIVVTNTGNTREAFRLKSDAVNGVSCRYYLDTLRSGRRAQDAQPVTVIGPLEPLEEAYLIMEVTTPSSAADSSEILLGTTIEPDKTKGPAASVALSLWFSRPIVEMTTAGREGKLKPAEISSYEFSVVNRGSNIAKTVEIRSLLPENLEILAADVPFVQGGSGEYFWNFPELGAGEKRVVRVSFRVRTGIPMGTNIQIKNLVTYEDQLGNRY